VAVQTPPAPPSTSDPGIEDGVIEEARARQRRHRQIGWALAATAVTGALIAGLVGGGVGAGRYANGQTRTSGSSPPATSSAVVPKEPVSLAVGPNGDLYVADPGREQILRRLPSGRFLVAAGTGVAGYTGDGGRATRAELDQPGSLAIAPNGAVYFVQAGRTKTSLGLRNSVVRKVEPSGKISTVIGHDPNCAVVPASSSSVPASSAEFSGASLTIGDGGQLDVSTTVCPNVLHLGGFLRLTSSGLLVQTSAGSIPETSGYCGGGIAGNGFIAFGCASGGGRGARLMIVRSNGGARNYPDKGSQPNEMATANGTVVAIHNGSVVRIGVDGLETIATQRQLAKMVSGAALRMGDNGIAIDRHGSVYVNEDFLVDRRGCTDVIVDIDPAGHMRKLWRSALTRSCY
jgi:hypothetical protein